jgi:hypothetical protein
MRNAK